jgi:hypothetical protein
VSDSAMFVYEIDPAFGFAVVLFAPPAEEDDFARYVELIPQLDRRGAEREAPVLLLEFGEGYPPPNAIWRKRFVDARASLASRPIVALVTPSRAMRAGIALARWIRPPTFDQSVFATVDEAMGWLAEARGPTAAKLLRRLYADARRRVTKPSR